MADDVPDSCGFSGLSSVPVRVTHYTFGGTTDNNCSGRVQNFQDTAVKFTHGHHSHSPTNHTAPASRMDCSPTPAMQQQHMGCNVYEVAFSTTPHVLSVLWQSGRPLWRHVKAQAKSAASCKDAVHQRHMMLLPLDEEVPKTAFSQPANQARPSIAPEVIVVLPAGRCVR